MRRGIFPPAPHGVCLLAVYLSTWVSVAALEAAQVEGLQTPQSFIADPAGDAYFISNVNGEPDARDNNGFITKLDQGGKITHLHFIRGGLGHTLHAPKGMAIVGDVLYVVDLDTIWGFDKETGALLVTIPFESMRHGRSAPISLTDIAHDGHGLLYASDTGANTIYRIELATPHTISVLAADPALAGPSGLAWNAKTNTLVAVSWDKGKIIEITAGGQFSELVSNGFFTARFHNLSGIDFDHWGSMYVSDFTAGKVWRIRPDMKFEVIAEFLPAPADLGIDRRNHLILVPYHYGNAAEINGLEQPGSAKKKRSFSDYGRDWMKKGPDK